MNPSDFEPGERFAREALRGLPLRPAPSALEARVRAELDRRSARAWWKRPFGRWPAGAQAAFVAASGLAAALCAGNLLELRGLAAAVIARVPGATVVAALSGAAGDLSQVIPPLWVEAGTALLLAGYAVLVVGAVAGHRVFARARGLCFSR